jgi:hypothetical protein
MEWVGGDSENADTMERLQALGYTSAEEQASEPGASLVPDPGCTCEWCEPYN